MARQHWQTHCWDGAPAELRSVHTGPGAAMAEHRAGLPPPTAGCAQAGCSRGWSTAVPPKGAVKSRKLPQVPNPWEHASFLFFPSISPSPFPFSPFPSFLSAFLSPLSSFLFLPSSFFLSLSPFLHSPFHFPLSPLLSSVSDHSSSDW